MTNEELREIIRKHDLWLTIRVGGERADLRNADLRNVDLGDADLSYADLSGADLRGAYLNRTHLRGAYLTDANLRGADLREADLRDADLRGADLTDANLRGARGYYQMCPCEGEFIAWKKCRTHDINNVLCIVKLLIPADAKRSSATTEKCRADKAIVLEIQDLKGNKIDRSAYSMHKPNFEYRVGETVIPKKPFCEDRWQECASGIHFFIDRKAAVEY